MRTLGIFFLVLLAFCAIPLLTYMATYNGFIKKEQVIVESERKVASCYQKRADELTNAESTVKAYADHENKTIIGHANARTGNIKPPDNATPEQMKEFIEAQNNRQASIMTFLRESVPNLKANVNFLQLQKKLHDIEQQCFILRNKQIEAVKIYNTSIHTFPSNLVAGMHNFTKKDQIAFEDEATNKKTPKLFQQSK